MEKLEKQIRALKIYAGLLTVIVLILAFTQLNHSGNFKEINAERINIVENNGTLRLAISNHERQDPGSFDGKKIPQRDRPAGLIFFNDEGDECGGLIYDGDKHSASMTYSIDQYKNDQVMQLQYSQEAAGDTSKLTRSYGLKLWDRDDRFPTTRLMTYVDSLNNLHNNDAYKAGIEKIRTEGWLGRERLFVGRDRDGEYGLFLSDTAGRPRLKICIDKNNQPVIESLDEKGAKAQIGR